MEVYNPVNQHILSELRVIVICLLDGSPPWGPGLEFGPPHPLVSRKRRQNGATCLPWLASCVGG
jgi:hypothetical protein